MAFVGPEIGAGSDSRAFIPEMSPNKISLKSETSKNTNGCIVHKADH